MAYVTLVAAYDTAAHAASAVKGAHDLGVPTHDIRRHPPADGAGKQDPAKDASGFWNWLVGTDEAAGERVRHYQEALQAGGTVISVRVLEEEAERVQAVLESFGPLALSVV